jgi:hypothetical protein
MPCFTLTLIKKNTVYNLEKMIMSQYDINPKLATTWPAINLQASFDNIVNPGKTSERPAVIKYGDGELSGLRWGLQLAPGQIVQWRLGTQFVSTASRNFLCEDMDGAQIAVELVTV